MRDPNRIKEVVEVLAALWRQYPDLRLGQLVANVCDDPYDTWQIEDDKFLARMKDKLKNGGQ